MPTSETLSKARLIFIMALGLLTLGLAVSFVRAGVSAAPLASSAAPIPAFASIHERPAASLPRAPYMPDIPAPVTPPCSPDWSIVPSPNQGTMSNELKAVAVVSSGDVWAVGFYTSTGGTLFQTLIEHWDGSTWSVVPSPNQGTSNNSLFAAAVVSSNDIWAVGNYYNGSAAQTLVEHWNGTQWNIVLSPNQGSSDNDLRAVAVVSPNEVWAVGAYLSGGFFQTLIEHWDGTVWSVVPSPNQGTTGSELWAVAVGSADDVWVVGHFISGGTFQTLVEHWDGTQWNIVPSPNVANSDNYLTAVAVASSHDIWAVGYYHAFGGTVDQTLIEHWDGTAWSIVPSPNPVGSHLYAVDVASANDVWAAGDYDTGSITETLAEHWNGSTWSILPSPNLVTGYQGLSALAVAFSSDVWAVGDYYTGSVYQSLVEHWDGTAWTIVPSLNYSQSTSDSVLSATAVASANDVWAVGSYRGSNSAEQTLVEHWDGSAWNIVPSPNWGEGIDNWLAGVAVASANDVWAVGGYFPNYYQGLIEHWDGTAWSIIPSPNPVGSRLFGVAVASTNDVWAVGYSGLQTLVEHWDGSTWSIVPSPSPSPANGYNILSAVAVASANDVWAVGHYYSTTLNQTLTLVEHWDGSAWNVVPSPSANGPDSILFDVAIASANDVWAVGNLLSDNWHTLVEHWDGSAWSVVPSPDQATDLYGVAVASASNVWAVGDFAAGAQQTLVENWDGSSWQIVPSPNQGRDNSALYGVAVASAGGVWGVGDFQLGNGSQTLVERYNPCTPTLTVTPTGTSTPTPQPTPQPTQTPGDPTATLMPSDTPTPVTCLIRFSDVPVGSTFYPYLHCLACLGIIFGYPCAALGEPCNPDHDPYFRPNNNVTRGQIAKIVALSAGMQTPVSGQTFEDVPPGSTFYTYTEQLYALGVMNGYPCGGEGEPCGSDNLPYFRPNSSATRGQISKIVSNAAGLRDPVGSQLFEDLVPGSTFYDFAQRLANEGVMSGYACGGTGEPCTPPNNRPYFRPANAATRGQTSKIVSNTFFPNCQTPARR